MSKNSIKPTDDDIKTTLRTSGYRATKARVAILKVLKLATAPVSMEDIEDKLAKFGIDQSTLYRTVNSLVESKLVRPVDMRHVHAHYELVGHDHHHVICEKCGISEDFEGCGVEDLKTRALKQVKGFAEIKDHSVELFGLCHKCFKKYAHSN